MTRRRAGRRWGGALAALALGVAGCGDDSKPGDDPERISVEECVARGGGVVTDPGDGSTLRDGCPDGRTFLGAIPFGEEGAICCKR